ncbi:hypothetical protein FZC79_04595 [Rossellomorea vietnamensis]|uniref:Uncharacterized protein n=1 Tax=Rossellomorea vietnamensis TaxID=218284 RepID=A0A5D4KIA3_9BACI|nr:hypothetical protein [Rossellomorea vietnamensis]TYR76981.1 hypothetical protein FZC79_04595 [Rossellomorea vietnamensis]
MTRLMNDRAMAGAGCMESGNSIIDASQMGAENLPEKSNPYLFPFRSNHTARWNKSYLILATWFTDTRCMREKTQKEAGI